MSVDHIYGPGGVSPEADGMEMAMVMAQRMAAGDYNRFTEMPRILQTAVILDHYRDAMALPGPLWLQRAILRTLAALGRRRGLTPRPSDEER